MLFAASITRMATNKWNKLGPVLDWTVLSSLPRNALGTSLRGVNVKKDCQRSDVLPVDADTRLEEEVDYAVLRGKRFIASLDTFNDAVRCRTLHEKKSSMLV